MEEETNIETWKPKGLTPDELIHFEERVSIILADDEYTEEQAERQAWHEYYRNNMDKFEFITFRLTDKVLPAEPEMELFKSSVHPAAWA